MPSSKKPNQKTKKSWKEPPSSQTIYAGPIVRPADRSESDLHSVLLTYTEFLSSDGAGVMKPIYSDDVSGYADWASFAAVYDEYRALGLRVEYFPDNRYSKTTTICRPLITALDRNDATVLASYSTAVAYASATKESLEDPWVREIRMNGVEDAEFVTTSTPAAKNYFKAYASGLSATVEYGMIVLYCLVQFRGKR